MKGQEISFIKIIHEVMKNINTNNFILLADTNEDSWTAKENLEFLKIFHNESDIVTVLHGNFIRVVKMMDIHIGMIRLSLILEIE